jgi:hypothetical protein
MGRGYTQEELNNRVLSAYLITLTATCTVFVLMSYSLKQLTNIHKYIAVTMSIVFFIAIHVSIDNGKQAGTYIIEKCSWHK